jgi:hypothetical protein
LRVFGNGVLRRIFETKREGERESIKRLERIV